MLYFKFRNKSPKVENVVLPEKNNTGFPYTDILFFPILFFCWLCDLYSSFKCSSPKLCNVEVWCVEYDDEEDNVVIREIGLDVNGKVVWQAPCDNFLGFWTDQDDDIEYYKTIMDFHFIQKEEFDELWDLGTFNN